MSNNSEFYSGRRILVTGGLGFLGLNLISHLVGDGALVRVLSHAEPGVGSLGTSFLEGVDCLEGDIRDANALRRALDGCEVVFNFAGRSGTIASNASPFEDLDTNVRGQLTFLK